MSRNRLTIEPKQATVEAKQTTVKYRATIRYPLKQATAKAKGLFRISASTARAKQAPAGPVGSMDRRIGHVAVTDSDGPVRPSGLIFRLVSPGAAVILQHVFHRPLQHRLHEAALSCARLSAPLACPPSGPRLRVRAECARATLQRPPTFFNCFSCPYLFMVPRLRVRAECARALRAWTYRGASLQGGPCQGGPPASTRRCRPSSALRCLPSPAAHVPSLDQVP